MQQNLKVSVCMITYGHEKYIREAIEGVLMQECDFKIELILANDCSPDQTDKVIQDILENHPRKSWIKYFKHEKNLGMMPNFIFAMNECQGKYIALCEGDDYWTDPLKLKKQVSFLEKNEEFVISCSNSHLINPDGSFIRIFNENEIPEITDTNYILTNEWYIPTASVVFRNINIELPKWFCKVLNGDYSLYLILTANGGLLHYKNEVRCNYRLHENGASNIFKKSEKIYNYSMLFIYKMFNDYSNRKYSSSIKIKIERYSINILKSLPVLSKEFWKISFNLFWFDKTLSRKYIDYFMRRVFRKIKFLLKTS